MDMSDPNTLDDLKNRATARIDQLRDELIGISATIHANPEVAFQETAASQLLMGWLAGQGFSVESDMAGLQTAFKASFASRSPGSSVAFLAEYDALPDLGHACGHNIIATASVGAAAAVASVMDALRGTILVIGTPAEEYGGGKITMMEKGAFDGIDAAMLIHPSTRTCAYIYALANETLDVEFFGQAAHAAAYPEKGINALDAMVISYVGISALRQQMRPDARVHGIITHGGEASNIIPAYTSGRFQVRAKDDAYLEVLLERVLDCFRAGAAATGARFEHRSLERRYSAMRNNEAMAQAFVANLLSLGVTVEDHDPSWGIGSTDMGNVSQRVPSIHPSVAIADKSVALHSPEFACAAASDRAKDGLILAAKALAMTAIDLLADAELMATVKKEFASSD
ncbi:MAG: M20 family metallopeptidase [Chloroflexota bacterium]